MPFIEDSDAESKASDSGSCVVVAEGKAADTAVAEDKRPRFFLSEINRPSDEGPPTRADSPGKPIKGSSRYEFSQAGKKKADDLNDDDDEGDQDKSGDYDPKVERRQLIAGRRKKPLGRVRRMTRQAKSSEAEIELGAAFESHAVKRKLSSSEGTEDDAPVRTRNPLFIGAPSKKSKRAKTNAWVQQLPDAEAVHPEEGKPGAWSEPWEVPGLKSNSPTSMHSPAVPSDEENEETVRQEIQIISAEDRVSGCFRCDEKQVTCSAVNNGVYPCEGCTEAGAGCRLMPAPDWDQPGCEVCQHRRIECSYARTGKVLDKCEACKSDHCNCVMTRGLTRPTLKLFAQPDSPTLVSPPSGPIRRGCNQCRNAKKKCSLIGDYGFENCIRCKCFKQHCLFDNSGPNAPPPDSPLVSSTAKSQPTVEPLPLSKVFTRLMHPLVVTNGASINGLPGCDWCAKPSYALRGLSEREIVVADVHGKGRTEKTGLPAPAGAHRSRMCVTCIGHRVRILSCEAHVFDAIPGTDPNTFDYSAVLPFASPDEDRRAPFPWCDVCLAAAFFECVAPCEEAGERPCDAPRTVRGCGLRVCEECAEGLEGTYEGDLPALVETRWDDPQDRLELRADAELLANNYFFNLLGMSEKAEEE